MGRGPRQEEVGVVRTGNMPSVAAVILSKLLPILCLTWKVGIIVLASWVIVIMKWDKVLYSVKSLEKQIP